MTQIATVENLTEDGQAKVRVRRQTACAHDCESCGGVCGSAGSLTVLAGNPLRAMPGERVLLETETRKILGAVALVYLVPLALLLLGCILPAALGAGETLQILGAAAGLLFGCGGAVAVNRYIRHDRAAEYTIVGRLSPAKTQTEEAADD